MTAQTVELRVTGVGMLLVNSRPATADEARAFWRFIEQMEAYAADCGDEADPECRHDSDLATPPPDGEELVAAFGSPSGGFLIKTEEAPDILN
jgi:hypothetical protein